MAAETQRLIERLHASETMAVVAVAGAGSKAVSWLLASPGASRTVLEVLVPYVPKSLAEFLGYEPEQSVSVQTSMDMARRAYRRAVRLREVGVPVVGVACTAAIATDRPKRGKHRCHVAAWSETGAASYSLQLVKGLRDRAGEETVVSNLILRALAEESHADFDLPMHLDDRERVQVRSVRYEDLISSLLAGHVDTVVIDTNGSMVADEAVRGGVLPGSFDPLHQGHRRLADVASDMLKSQVTFELSVTNVDKPPLEEPEVRKRVAQFAGKWPVVISQATVFSEKARMFPGCTLIIGWDTAVRLVDARYYGGEEFEAVRALDEIRDQGCRFLVAGRVDGGVFRTLENVPVPRGFEDMFTPIPESAFRHDLTSTELRLAGRRP